MVPWDPPPFGIPEEILEKLTKKLIDEVIRLGSLNHNTGDNEGRQSSPQSVTDSLPPADDDYQRMRKALGWS